MIGEKRYTIKINIPLDYEKKGAWYENKQGFTYHDCYLSMDFNFENCYYINDGQRIPYKYANILEVY